MDKFIMTYVESIIDQYFLYRIYVWCIISLLSVVLTITGICLYRKHKKYAINRIFNKVFVGAAIIVTGILFNRMNLKLEIQYTYFNASVFIIGIFLIILYGIMKGIIFVNSAPLLHLCRYLQIGCLVELFLLANTDFLEFGEGLTGILVIACTEIMMLLKENSPVKNKDQIDKESDYPNPELFYTRGKQLDKFIHVLQQQKKEPYAIMISGKWGSGKNSFVMALEERLKIESPKDSFIWVRAGSEKTVSEIVSEISGQIMEILRKNNIYIGHEDIVEKYFLAFSDLLENKGWGFWKKITSNFEYNTVDDGKGYVNSMLTKLQGTIYIVVDDLDRCSHEYTIKMFKVIRECTQLVNCKTILLMDKAKFMKEDDEDYDIKYFEKYISYTLDLCEVDYREIADFYTKVIFKEDFFTNMHAALLPNVSPEKIPEIFKNVIYTFPQEILKRLESEEETLKKVNISSLSEGTSQQQERLGSLEKIIQEIHTNIVIARTVKSFLKSIKRNMLKLNDEMEHCSEELLKENWFQAVIEVQFLKYFAPTAFFNVQMSGSILRFGKTDNNYGLITALGLKLNALNYNERRSIILDYIISKIDVMDSVQIKTQEDMYLGELYHGAAILDHVDEYLLYAKSCDDLVKIFEAFKDYKFVSEFEKEFFVEQLLNAVSQLRSPLRSDNRKFLTFSEDFVGYLITVGMTNQLKENVLKAGDVIVNSTLSENARFFSCILSMVYKMSEVLKISEQADIYNINSFHSLLVRLDQENKYGGGADESDKIGFIRLYFLCIEKEVMSIDDREARDAFSDLFGRLRDVLSVCEFWYHIQDTFEKEVSTFHKYFMLNNFYDCRSNVYENVNNIIAALNALCDFYALHLEDYKSEYSLILLRMSITLVQICERSKTAILFEGKKKEVGELLRKAASLVYQADRALNQDAQDTVNQIRVNVHRFWGYVKENRGDGE
ncbi:MAG: hypothetical protein J1E01_11655 [Acetatifactor sp.]|nr:hypothetical protein [Acetatifactor sp.]